MTTKKKPHFTRMSKLESTGAIWAIFGVKITIFEKFAIQTRRIACGHHKIHMNLFVKSQKLKEFPGKIKTFFKILEK